MRRNFVLLCATLGILWAGSNLGADAHIEALTDRITRELWTDWNLDVIDELYAEDFIRVAPTAGSSTMGREAYKRYLQRLRTTYPDFKVVVEDRVVEGNTAMDSWRVTGTSAAPGRTEGKKLDVRGTSYVTFAGGKVVRTRLSWDTLSIPKAWGLSPNLGLTGAWQLVNYAYSRQDTSFEITDPQASLIIISKLYYSSMHVRGDAPRTLFGSRTAPTDDEKLAAYNTVTANSGTFEVADSTITFRPVVAKNPNFMSGGSNSRVYKLNGDSLRLTYRGPGRQDSTQTVVSHATYTRIE